LRWLCDSFICLSLHTVLHLSICICRTILEFLVVTNLIMWMIFILFCWIQYASILLSIFAPMLIKESGS
jgi:hypothetical protein